MSPSVKVSAVSKSLLIRRSVSLLSPVSSLDAPLYLWHIHSIMRRSQDHYSRRAKKEGYPARSVYKLEEIQKKHSLFRSGSSVLDVGAAPGSWSLWVSRRFGARIVAVDLKEMPELAGISGITALSADLYADDTRRFILDRGPFDVVMSDAAPSTSGNRGLDATRSAALVESVLDLARLCLKPGGRLIAKLFQGSDEQAILAQARTVFKKALYAKPKATRSESFEVFLVAIDYRGAETDA